MVELSPLILIILTVLAFVSGWISSIAGSGGLLIIPAMMAVGVPPLNALATNKVATAMGNGAAMLQFRKAGYLDISELLPLASTVLVGAALGTLAVQYVDSGLLARIVPIQILVMALLLAVQPKIGLQTAAAKMSKRRFAYTLGPILGLYAGFFGPGLGSVMPLLMAWLLGYDLVRGTAETKLLVVVGTVVSSVLFIAGGHVWWTLALCTGVAQVLGARLGSRLVLKHGAGFVKKILLVSVVAMTVKLLLFP